MNAPEEHYEIVAEPATTGDDRSIVLASGDSFAVFDLHGGFEGRPGGRHGLYVDGTRFLSTLGLRVGGGMPLLLGSGLYADRPGFFVHETSPDLRDRSGLRRLSRDQVHISRHVTLSDAACGVDFAFRSYAEDEILLPLELSFAADFVDLFEVRGCQRRQRGRALPPLVSNGFAQLGYQGLDGIERRTRIRLPETRARLFADAARLSLLLRPGETIELPLRIECELREGNDSRRCGFALGGAGSVTAFEPRLASSNRALDRWIRRSASDLGMLTVATPRGPFPYAGVPWYFTPFGRDALITAHQVLWLDPALARSVLSFLAGHQATHDDPARDAEVGKIVHEMRAGEMAALHEVPFRSYYGSVDATPLFAWLAAAYHERTGDDVFLEELWPQLELALGWIDGRGDPDRDGFVEYAARSSSALANQGWKDSRDAVMHADGSLAQGPIALCEVQAYVYGAKSGLARVARRLGREVLAERLEAEAERLRKAFATAFWCEDLGCFALALDGAKRKCRVRSSNSGQALLTGIALPEHAAQVAETLLSEDHFSGWGIRTLARSAARYNPMSYHNGSVWPHDNALIAAGLARYGEARAAERIFGAMLDACRELEDARLPELLCGFERRAGERPVRYPVACSPQAWSAGAVFLLLQAVLGISVDAPARRLGLIRSRLPAALDHLRVSMIGFGGEWADLGFERVDDRTEVIVSRRSGGLDVVVSPA